MNTEFLFSVEDGDENSFWFVVKRMSFGAGMSKEKFSKANDFNEGKRSFDVDTQWE